MNNRELNRQVATISSLLDKVDNACGEDFELQSQWAKHICVLVAGFMENSVKELFREYIDNRSEKRVANFAKTHLRRIRNPKAGKIAEIVGAFDSDWGKNVEQYLQDDGRGDAVDSIMNNRHHIAHGQTSTITIVRIKEYMKKAIDVVDYLEQQTH